MTKLQIIIADDEIDAINVLSSILIDTGKVEIVKTIQNPVDIQASVLKLSPDALFLDIQMPKLNGIDIIQQIREYDLTTPIIFVSAYEQYIPEAIKHQAFSFLTKPVNIGEVEKLVDKLIQRLNDIPSPSISNKIKLPVKDGYVYLKEEEILFLEAEGNYTEVVTINEDSYISSYNMGKLVQRLSNTFLRINRNCYVNGEYVFYINRKNKTCQVKVRNKKYEKPISQSFLSNVRNL